MRVERDESYFRPRRVIEPGDDPGQTIEMPGDCLIRRLLKIWVERRFDPQDPYVQTAIKDSIRAGLVVYPIYWKNTGRANNTRYESDAGQNLLLLVAQATGGNSYWQGLGNPVSLQPFFQDLRRRLSNQYEVSFTAPSNGKTEVKSLKVDLHVPSAKVASPQQVLVTGPVSARGE